MIKTVELNNVISREMLEQKLAIPAGMDLPKVSTDGVFILFHRKSDNYPLMTKTNSWAVYQNNGEIADGVAVVEGGKILVIAPTETSLCWSSAAVSGGGTTISNRLIALNDWAGKANTAAQITHAECQGVNYASGFCSQYSRANANGQGLTAGKWWLPSLGELMMMCANMHKINYALSLINGATPLAETWYWSSTEPHAVYAWRLYFNDGLSNYGNKAEGQGNVRPVSAFIA